MRRKAVALLALALLVSCSGGAEDPGAGTATPGATKEAGGAADNKAPTRKEIKKQRMKAQRRHRHHRRHRDARLPGDGRDVALEEPANEDDNSSALYPEAGLYAYDQRGYERFCQAAGCTREPLPSTEELEVSLRDAGAGRAVVVSEARAADDRVLRTTTVYSRERALITDVYTKMVYRGFAFENAYHPDPPVVAMRLPLEEGDSWSGTWSDSTSGSYEMSVLGTEALEVGGASVGAIKLSSVINFSGQFEGEAKTITWVDPATKATVRSSGTMDLTSSYGRYQIEFSQRLRSGPGYG